MDGKMDRLLTCVISCNIVVKRILKNKTIFLLSKYPNIKYHAINHPQMLANS